MQILSFISAGFYIKTHLSCDISKLLRIHNDYVFMNTRTKFT